MSCVDQKPNDEQQVARSVSSLPKHLLPFPAEYSFRLQGRGTDVVSANLQRVINSFECAWRWNPQLATGVGFVAGNVWSRAYRRKQAAGRQDTSMRDADGDDNEEENAALGFKIRFGQEPEYDGTVVSVRWLKGNDPVLFESFCGMLKRKLADES